MPQQLERDVEEGEAEEEDVFLLARLKVELHCLFLLMDQSTPVGEISSKLISAISCPEQKRPLLSVLVRPFLLASPPEIEAEQESEERKGPSS